MTYSTGVGKEKEVGKSLRCGETVRGTLIRDQPLEKRSRKRAREIEKGEEYMDVKSKRASGAAKNILERELNISEKSRGARGGDGFKDPQQRALNSKGLKIKPVEKDAFYQHLGGGAKEKKMSLHWGGP